MRITHTSPAVITKITDRGLFDDCLFFSDNEYAMGDVAAVYELEISEDEIIDVSELSDESMIQVIADQFDVDMDTAERILDGRDTALEHTGDAEDDWFVQATQGQCAKIEGFKACQSIDEQGTVYIVPMLGREADLIKVK